MEVVMVAEEERDGGEEVGVVSMVAEEERDRGARQRSRGGSIEYEEERKLERGVVE